jgi:hypothetical protein
MERRGVWGRGHVLDRANQHLVEIRMAISGTTHARREQVGIRGLKHYLVLVSPFFSPRASLIGNRVLVQTKGTHINTLHLAYP